MRRNAEWDRVCALVGEDRSYWRTGRQGKWKAKALPTWHDGEVREGEPARSVRFKFWMEGAPEWLHSHADIGDDVGEDTRNTRSVFSWDLRSGHDTLVGWRHLLTVPCAESECPDCGPGTGWDESEEQERARAREPNTNTGYRGQPRCKVCEGSGYVYGGCAALVVYAREVAR